MTTITAAAVAGGRVRTGKGGGMRVFRGALLVVAGMMCSGCASYQWEYNIERAEQKAKAEKRYLFVFYKWWLDNDSNRMIADVLDKPDTAQLFQNTVNCQLFYENRPSREYVARHGIDRAPGFLIKAPDGAYQAKTGYIPKEAFIKWAQAAMTQHASRPPTPPPLKPAGTK